MLLILAGDKGAVAWIAPARARLKQTARRDKVKSMANSLAGFLG
jgi:hypothetical protein